MSAPECDCKQYIPPIRTSHCSPQNHHVILHKLCDILQQKMSEEMTDRHIFLLNEATKACKHGFYVRDLEYIICVMELITDRLEEMPQYRKPFQNFLEICALPPIMHDASEAFNEIKSLPNYFTVLGFLTVWVMYKNLREIVYSAILQVLQCYKKPCICSVSLQQCHRAIEKSFLPEIITQLIENVSDDEYIQILKLCVIISRISDQVCHKMIDVGVVDYLCLRLINTDAKSYICTSPMCDFPPFMKTFDYLELTLKALWCLANSLKTMEQSKKNKIKGPCQNALWGLRYALRGSLFMGKGQVRNNIMGLILRFLDLFPRMHFVESGLAEDIILLSVATEIKPKNTWAEKIEFVVDDNYICFKKMMLLCLCYLDRYPSMRKMIDDYHIIAALVELIMFQKSSWHIEQQISLAKYALHILYKIGPYFLRSIIESGGPIRMLIIIESSVVDTFDDELLELTLKTLHMLVHLKNTEFIESVLSNFGIFALTQYCNRSLDILGLSHCDQRCLSYCFALLTQLHRNQSKSSEYEINLVHKYFQRVLHPYEKDSCLNPQPVICAIDYLWKMTYQNAESLNYFIKKGSLYTLLDLIQVSILPIQVIALGCLVDMCEDVACVPFLLTWRGGQKKELNIFSLFAGIFRNENNKIGIKSDLNGVISDLTIPLMGKEQFNLTYKTKHLLKFSPSVGDLLGSSRPKIYALIQMINYRYATTTQTVNDEFQIASRPLSCKDQVVIHMAENFLILKLSEAWNELAHNLNVSGIIPVMVDRQMLNTLKDQMKHWVQCVKEKQECITQEETDVETMRENKLYNTLRETKINTAINGLRQLKYIARSTNRKFMLQYKKKQRAEIRRMMHFFPEENRFLHKTFNRHIHTTAVFHQHLVTEHAQLKCEMDIKN